MSSTSAARVSLLALALVGCSKEAPPKPETTQPAVQAQAPAPVAAALTAQATAAPTATAVATAVASAIAAPAESSPRTSRPTPLRWCSARHARIEVPGYTHGCEMAMADEWIMVWCSSSRMKEATGEAQSYDRAVPGGGSMANDEEIAVGPEGGDAVVISLRPGTRAKPIFFYRPDEHRDWAREQTFTFELPAGATSLAAATLDGSPLPSLASREKPEACKRHEAEEARVARDKEEQRQADDTKGQPDVEGISAAPLEADAAAEKEVNVSGSGALGCVTKVVREWFWMRCEGKAAITAVEVERGKRPTQTRAEVASGAAHLVTPYVEGTDLRAKLAIQGGDRYLHLRWLKGKRPTQVGTITDQR